MNTSVALNSNKLPNTIKHKPTNSPLINKLKKISQSHKIWQNPLLLACSAGSLQLNEFKQFFTQYYYYSRNFTKLIAAGMCQCDNDAIRSKLSANLWEEGGGIDIEHRHSEILKRFLINGLGIDEKTITTEFHTEFFFKQYLALCLNSGAVECAAVLSFATEGIVPRLYKIFKQGLLAAGLKNSDLTFFTIHIACDDDHALTLEEMALSYMDEPMWFERCKEAINKALDLRNSFFENIFQSLQRNKLNQLIDTISHLPDPSTSTDITDKLHYQINKIKGLLYTNKDMAKRINFAVDRIPFNTDVLDPRLVRISPGFTNELYRHAHEIVLLILSGNGKVKVNEQILSIKAGDLIHIPRWSLHQTFNSGSSCLIYFAVTDYGLTRRCPLNS